MDKISLAFLNIKANLIFQIVRIKTNMIQKQKNNVLYLNQTELDA